MNPSPSNIIPEIRGGAGNKALIEALRTASERVKATGKKAKVVLTLTLQPTHDEIGTETVLIGDKVEVKLPELPQKMTLFFIDPETFDLSRTNPQQLLPGVTRDDMQKVG